MALWVTRGQIDLEVTEFPWGVWLFKKLIPKFDGKHILGTKKITFLMQLV